MVTQVAPYAPGGIDKSGRGGRFVNLPPSRERVVLFRATTKEREKIHTNDSAL